MQLREAELVRALDEHHRRVRHIDAHFDHGRGEQHHHAAFAEIIHHPLLLVRGKAAVHQPDAMRGEGFLEPR